MGKSHICHSTSRACSRAASAHSCAYGTHPTTAATRQTRAAHRAAEKTVVAVLVRLPRLGYQRAVTSRHAEKCSKVQQGAARFVQLVRVEVSAQSQQKYAKCQHRNAPPRNKSATGFRPSKYPERWAFRLRWLTKTEQDVTRFEGYPSRYPAEAAFVNILVNSRTEVLRDGCTDEVTRMVTPKLDIQCPVATGSQPVTAGSHHPAQEGDGSATTKPS